MSTTTKENENIQPFKLGLNRMEAAAAIGVSPATLDRLWGKSVGTTIQVGVAKIRHGDNGGKATLLGSIINEPKK